MKYILLVLILFISNFTFSQDYSFTKIDDLLKDVEAEGPGVIVGVVKDEKLIHLAAKGMANLDYNIPLDTNSNFRLSSTSKQFTATCVLHLVEVDKLKFSDPLSDYFPELSSAIGKVTVQNLLNHTFGIRDYMSLMSIRPSYPNLHKTDSLMTFVSKDKDANK
ncbi:MAG: CubicO group peptidase (beta-lactamase class C family), partial [Saprospiraceae bacterium]